jgi:hypothetical protein
MTVPILRESMADRGQSISPSWAIPCCSNGGRATAHRSEASEALSQAVIVNKARIG